MKRAYRYIALIIVMAMIAGFVYALFVEGTNSPSGYGIIAVITDIEQSASGEVTAVIAEEIQNDAYGTVRVLISSGTAIQNAKYAISAKQLLRGDYIGVVFRSNPVKSGDIYEAKASRIDVFTVASKT